MISLLDLTLADLTLFCAEELGQSAFRARLIWKWIWQKRAGSFAGMSDLPLELRSRLADAASLERPQIAAREESRDGTLKFLLRLADGAKVESVLIPAPDGHLTLCLSCQVGCAMGCSFCGTGSLGFSRNMTCGEILSQVLLVRDFLGDSAPRLRNLVFMGMGEPLLNLRNVLRSLEIMGDDAGLGFSRRRISVSTCGLPEGLAELGAGGLASLTVSLHAPTQELRSALMPRAAAWPLPDLLAALRSYPLRARERLTFAYLLLGGVNDSPEQARRLAGLLAPLKAKLNLIAYNPVPGLDFRPPDPEDVLNFERILWASRITVILRRSMGGDISAACGQLVAGRNPRQATETPWGSAPNPAGGNDSPRTSSRE
ncbi:MAG: 23S rRNA (adenine(2503)-C(2))-methyltransferase RlmN [Deltaproteobacteria bacterium]|jgi:23S rRNA (adenine2503-C2)-methyltransferase|nr:23S rRNA (adenine(2503)-C(2))-methyltransferase RlmN [Deltaproteobacteria bacterium]